MKRNPLASFLLLTGFLLLGIWVGLVEPTHRSEKLPVFALVDIFHVPPESRQKCSTILGWLATKYPNNYVLMSMRNIIYQLALPHSQLQENAEKELIAAMDSLQGTMSNVSGLEPGTYISILTCSVDNKGRTILQKMVEHGLVQALSHTLSQKFWVGAKLNLLLDMEGNNLAHLAAMSENDELVHFVLGIMFKSNVVADMLESVNSHGQKPIDIAIYHRDQQTVDTMKNFFRVTTLAEREGFVDGVEVIEDSAALAEKEEEKKLKEFIEKEESAASKINKPEITRDIEYAKQEDRRESFALPDSGRDEEIRDVSLGPDSASQSYESSVSEDSITAGRVADQIIEEDFTTKSGYQERQGTQQDALMDENIQERTFSDENVPDQVDENEVPNVKEGFLSLINRVENSHVLDSDSDSIPDAILLDKHSKPLEPALSSLRGSGGELDAEQQDSENDDLKGTNKEPRSKWSATAKAVVGASILVGTSILAATVVFIVCKGYGNKDENSV
ncbi:Ankyrin repeat family protein [Cryptosporidium felis]|nr:Ankyrin repeat family protein [Cryptosporidium felis]